MDLIRGIIQFRDSNQARLLWTEMLGWAKSMIHITSASTHIDHDSLR